MNGKILIVGIAALAIGLAGLVGNAENGFMNTAVTQIQNNGCQGACNNPPSSTNNPTIPALVTYPLLIAGAALIIFALTRKSPRLEAT